MALHIGRPTVLHYSSNTNSTGTTILHTGCSESHCALFYTIERVFLVEHVFREGDRYTDLVRQKFADAFSDITVLHRNAVCNLLD